MHPSSNRRRSSGSSYPVPVNQAEVGRYRDSFPVSVFNRFEEMPDGVRLTEAR